MAALCVQLTSAVTLFPYTTLFRSGEGRYGRIPLDGGQHLHGLLSHLDVRVLRDRLQGALHRVDGVIAALGRDAGPDRKSTRLNSSHRTNSYAVLSMKKKNSIIQST